MRSEEEVGALWNNKTILDDRSLGIHDAKDIIQLSYPLFFMFCSRFLFSRQDFRACQ